MSIIKIKNPMAYLIVVLIWTVLLNAGCATSNKPEVTGLPYSLPYQLKEIEGSYWWRIQFLIPWGEAGNVDWPVDLLLAHAVVSPVLIEHANELSFWRFHRRAVRDATGHKFSFIFYSEPKIAKSIITEIKKSDILSDALNEKIVNKILTDNLEEPSSPNIGDTSDPHWSKEIQDSWPPFIMGVSSLWLGLISEEMKNPPSPYEDIYELMEGYKLANESISEKWRIEGQHAFIHHLSAIFGYHPMLIKKNINF